MKIFVKRVYEKPAKSDGLRVLVDRLWPRGLTKKAAKIDVWLKGIAPSDELRQWFGHDPAKWAQFKRRYFDELSAHPEEVDKLAEMAKAGSLTLLYSTKETEHNNAIALKEFLEKSFNRAAILSGL